MKLHYYPETDGLYVELKAGTGAETREVSDGLNVDLDAAATVDHMEPLARKQAEQITDLLRKDYLILG